MAIVNKTTVRSKISFELVTLSELKYCHCQNRPNNRFRDLTRLTTLLSTDGATEQ